MNPRVSLISRNSSIYQGLKKDQLPIRYGNSLAQPLAAFPTRQRIALVPTPSNDQVLEILIPELVEALPSSNTSPRTWGYLREAQIAAYRQAEQFQSTGKDQRLHKVDKYV